MNDERKNNTLFIVIRRLTLIVVPGISHRSSDIAGSSGKVIWKNSLLLLE
jgi:hypothetical protein